MGPRWLILLAAAVVGSACGVADDGPGALPASPDASIATTAATTPAVPSSTELSSTVPVATDDPADQYLPDTDIVYQRTMPSGDDVVVRRSRSSYADTFGYTWRAPTGDAATCLGQHALFVGVPGRIGSWGSAWIAAPWFDVAGEEPRVLAAFFPANRPIDDFSYFVVVDAGRPGATVRSRDPSMGVIDEITAADGLAVVVAEPGADGVPIISVVTDGAERDIAQSVVPAVPACSPGDPPVQPLPSGSNGPSDPDTAEQAIRRQLARVVDPAIPWTDKADSLDDATGVADAAAQARAGQFGDQAQSARYGIDELSFTSARDAWFRYTITTNAGRYPNRIGRAVLIDNAWRITRATICQDLAFATAPCTPRTDPVTLPADPAYDRAYSAWMEQAQLYVGNDGCAPLSQC